MSDFNGLVAVVTGGASGIGGAAAALLADRGAMVAVLDRSTVSDQRYASIVCDITDQAQVDAAIEQTVAKFGRLDVLLNNAGIGAVGDATDNDDDEWRRVFDVNVLGIVHLTRATIHHLRRSPSPAIVNTCSVVATVGVPQRALYSASKGAVASLTLAMAADYVHEGIRVNAVLPGTADTPWVSRLLGQALNPSEARDQLQRRQPIGRLVTADEVAQALVYLASPLTRSTTGSLLTIDGGMSGLRLPENALA
jgi:2-keto-3-deoxy-L-fuconate dehydrogenase